MYGPSLYMFANFSRVFFTIFQVIYGLPFYIWSSLYMTFVFTKSYQKLHSYCFLYVYFLDILVPVVVALLQNSLLYCYFFTWEINAEVAVVKLLLSAHSLEVFFRHAFFHRGVPECERNLVPPDDLKTHAK